jgi:gluconate 2-dehydrogenase gamma chain
MQMDVSRPRDDRLAAGTAVPAVPAEAVLGADGCSPAACGPAAPRFFTSHEAAVVEAASARIAPGPDDDPAEVGHPGAREAGVTGYIDLMLGALSAVDGTAPMIFAGGPWSNRHTSGPDHMASFLPLDPVARIAWRERLTAWREQYRQGIASLDELAGGDFTQATHEAQDKILVGETVATFRSLLFEHTIEGLYASPEYGGNLGLTGWKEIGYPGDVQPRGYTSAEVERSDGRDPAGDAAVVSDVLKFLGGL